MSYGSICQLITPLSLSFPFSFLPPHNRSWQPISSGNKKSSRSKKDALSKDNTMIVYVWMIDHFWCSLHCRAALNHVFWIWLKQYDIQSRYSTKMSIYVCIGIDMHVTINRTWIWRSIELALISKMPCTTITHYNMLLYATTHSSLYWSAIFPIDVMC